MNVPTTVEQKLWLFCALHRWRRSTQLQLFNLCKLHSLSGPAVTKETNKPASWSIPLLADVLKESYYIFWLKSLFYGQSKGIDQGALQGVVLRTENYFLNLVYSMLPTIICLCTGLSADSYCESTRYDYWSQFELCVFCSNPMHGSAFPQICHVSDTKSQCDTDTESQNQCWYPVIVICTRFTLYWVFLHFMEIYS